MGCATLWTLLILKKKFFFENWIKIIFNVIFFEEIRRSRIWPIGEICSWRGVIVCFGVGKPSGRLWAWLAAANQRLGEVRRHLHWNRFIPQPLKTRRRLQTTRLAITTTTYNANFQTSISSNNIRRLPGTLRIYRWTSVWLKIHICILNF